MRKEHKHHVFIVSLMMVLVLAVFVFVILSRPSGSPSGITSYISPGSQLEAMPIDQVAITNQQVTSPSTNVEIDVLIGFLILLALLFIWYVAIKIAKELRENKHHS